MKFEEFLVGFVERILELICRVLKDVGFVLSELDKVIFVGGFICILVV